MKGKNKFNIALIKRNRHIRVSPDMAQRFWDGNNGWISTAPDLLYMGFTENDCDFNFQLQTINQKFNFLPLKKLRMPANKQLVKVSNFVRRPDVSILIINEGMVSPQTLKAKSSTKLLTMMLVNLMTILLERYRIFKGDPAKGMVILSTCSLTADAHRLEAHLLELAHQNKIDPEFLDWIEFANYFCNVYVDMPGINM